MPEPVAFTGHGGEERTARWLAPRAAGEEPAPGLLVAPAGGEPAGEELALGASFAEEGFGVLLPDLSGRSGDREVLVDLDGALGALARRPEVDGERVAALGVGAGGTRAFLLGCHSRALAAAAAVDAPFVYPGLGPERPVQPLELALNLSCPLLAVFARAEAPADAERLERVLSQFARDFDIVVDPALAGPEELRRRVLSFLSRAFAEA